MRIGIPKEPKAGQSLVSATPDTVTKIVKLGYEVLVESGAGLAASYPDHLYEAAGATLASTQEVWKAEIVTSLDTPPQEYVDLLQPGATIIARLAPRLHPEIAQIFADRKVTALAMDAVPRISRAQSMDVLSSLANIGGYRAVVEAAHAFGRLFTGQVTAAGKVPPARVYVIGAGVAGLAAIGTANSMGAIVKATDLRAEVAEQVQSMGAEFVAIPAPAQHSSDGYAKEMSEDQAKAALALYSQQCAQSDIVITTAQIPGRPAPLLITAEAVSNMKPGSVIVDMAASSLGGNCEITRPGEVYVTDNGVTIIGYTDLSSRLPGQASQLYGQNIVNLLKLMTPAKDGNITFNLDDEIVRGIILCHESSILWPPPPISVSAAPTATPKTESKDEQIAQVEAENKSFYGRFKKVILGLLTFAIVYALWVATPSALLHNYIILTLSVVCGYYVITNVTHSLHTPLMAETNAISGIILVGAILSLASSTQPIVTILAFIAIFVASINIFGGFYVTHRMLKMFKKEQ